MQVPANTTSAITLTAQGDAQEARTNQQLTADPKGEQASFASIAEPLQQLLPTFTNTPTQDPTFLQLTTAARDAWSSVANALHNLLYPQPTTIITAPAQPDQVAPAPDTTIIAPPSNDTANPTPGDTVVVVPPADQPPGSSGGTPPSGANDQTTPVVTPNSGTGSTSGTDTPSLIPSYAREFERTGEIEWRPRLDKGNLRMYFRPEHEKLAEKVQILSPDGKTLLATGKMVGLAPDGRPMYDFDKPGSSFPDGAVVVMTFKNGKGARMVQIPETSERYVHGKASAPGTGTGGTNTNQPLQSLVPSGAREFEKTGEIEWRPRLVDGKLGIIFRKSHVSEAEKVQILSPDGTKVLATGTRTRTTEDGRPIYSFDKPGAEFPDGAIVMMTLKGGGVRTMKIPETSAQFVHGKTPPSSSGTTSGGQVGGGPGVGNGNPSSNSPSLIPSTAKDFDKTGQIEWRPRLNNGNLSLIFRRSHKEIAQKVQIFSPDGKTVLATGKLQRILADGRPVYVFDKAGSSFPDGAVVVMTLKDGGVRKLSIPETSKEFRY